MTYGGVATRAAQQATGTIPIVMAVVQKGAKALGLTIPQSVLLRADEVIHP